MTWTDKLDIFAGNGGLMKKNEQSHRAHQITAQYLAFLDRHLADIVSGKTLDMLELRDIAAELCMSHQHLTDVVKRVTGYHPCHFFDEKILAEAKKMLTGTDWSAAEIARRLTYDPSNFSKFFKKYTGQTPGRFRASQAAAGKQARARRTPGKQVRGGEIRS